MDAHSANAFRSALPRWKRALDLGLCLTALPVLAALTAVMSILMSVASPGPIFFKQERVGYRGRRFKLYKFRTMHVCADQTAHQAYVSQLVQSNSPMQKFDARDSRLIFGGWLLRATGLDELPQIVNVLRGEMSFVGPRPCIPYEYEQYTAEQRARFDSMPGLTGLWQVSGKNNTTFSRMVELDVKYAQAKTLLLDLRIIFQTPMALAAQVLEVRPRPRTPVIATEPAALPRRPEYYTTQNT